MKQSTIAVNSVINRSFFLLLIIIILLFYIDDIYGLYFNVTTLIILDFFLQANVICVVYSVEDTTSVEKVLFVFIWTILLIT